MGQSYIFTRIFKTGETLLPPDLDELCISDNKIKTIISSKTGKTLLPPKITHLEISDNGIDTLEDRCGDTVLPPSLEYFYFLNNNISSLESSKTRKSLLPSTLYFLDVSGNKLSSFGSSDGGSVLPQNLEILYADRNKITTLENFNGGSSLGPKLIQLAIDGNYINTFESTRTGEPLIPPSLEELYATHNNITTLENSTGESVLPPNIKHLYVSGNKLKSLESSKGNLLLPHSITMLEIDDNEITSLPIGLVRLTNLIHFSFVHNPIENVHPSVQRFIRNINSNTISNTKNTVYDDKQNVHNIEIQNSIRDSLNSLTTYKQVLAKSKFPEDEISFLDDQEVHSFFHFTQKEVLLFVENAIEVVIKNNETKEQLYSLLKEALIEGRSVCSTGRIGRMVNVLSGFDDNVQIKISDKAQIGAIVSTFRERGEPKERVEEELIERGVSKEEIDEWLEYY